MKHPFKLIIIIFMIAGPFMTISGQTTDNEISIPLTTPGKSGVLIASSKRGAITVKGTQTNQVTLKVLENVNEEEDDYEDDNTRNGMRKISSNMLDAEIVEENNNVSIQMNSNNSKRVEITIPQNFSVKISTHHDGDVVVTNINGQIEISAHHGDVTIEDVSGSAIVDTHHGEIKAGFKTIDSSKPMAFTTYHGDVQVSFPGNINCSPKIKTTKGDIYTDYEMSIEPQKTSIEDEGKKKKIKIGGWVHGKIGSGGEEYMFSTYHGDVIIQKNKA